jgi:hypothetical protein
MILGTWISSNIRCCTERDKGSNCALSDKASSKNELNWKEKKNSKGLSLAVLPCKVYILQVKSDFDQIQFLEGNNFPSVCA